MPEWAALLTQAAAERRACVVGALITDEHGRVFVQRRAPDRRLFPGCWDVVGGHVEAGEEMLAALAREIAEETGWQLHGPPRLLYVADWEVDTGGQVLLRREFDFLVEVNGDLRRPRLERPKHTEFRWLGPDELAVLDDNRGADDGLVRRLVERALRSAGRAGLTDPHATIFLGVAGAAVDELRRVWDPALAEQIAAHVTVAYPPETRGLDELVERVERAAHATAPFRLRLGRLRCVGDPEAWIFAEVEDADGGWARLRRLVVHPEDLVSGVSPHVTVVHPRTTNRGVAAWRALSRDGVFGTEFTVHHLAVTAFDGHCWRTIDAVELGG